MINKVIIFGKQLYHNDGYINFGFYNAFIEMGYDAYWICKNNLDEIKGNEKNTMFVINETENCNIIPLDKSNYYVIIKGDSKHFRSMDKNRVHLFEYSTTINLSRYTKIEDYIYEFRRKRTLIMPYASIATPNQIIDNLKDFVDKENREDKIVLVRNYDNNIQNDIINANSKCLTIKKLISLDNEVDLIRKVKLSCCFTSNVNKIDHKVLTHVAYGTMCMTNSLLTDNLLKNKLCYLANTSTLDSVCNAYFDSIKKEELFDLIEYILNNHTFVNRIKTILNYFRI